MYNSDRTVSTWPASRKECVHDCPITPELLVKNASRARMIMIEVGAVKFVSTRKILQLIQWAAIVCFGVTRQNGYSISIV